jgi:hypothetical protein
VLRCDRGGEEGIVLGLETESAVVSDVFEITVESAGFARIFEWRGRVDLHDVLGCVGEAPEATRYADRC